MPNVLVFDGEWESALSIVQSLGRKGICVTAGSSEASPLSACSRYCRGVFRYTDPLKDARAFQDEVLAKIAAESFDLVIPVTDSTIFPLAWIRETVEKHAKLALSSSRSLDVFASKGETYDLARRCGIATPETVRIESLAQAGELALSMGYPVVLKPDRSKRWSDGDGALNLSSVFVSGPEELGENAARLLALTPLLLQKRVIGDMVGLGVLAKDGEILTAFQFRSMHETPLSGGISTYRVSEPVEPKLLEAARALLAGVSWTGVAHVEFIQELSTARYLLMEINGRFWASLPIAVKCGADFPFDLYTLFTGGEGFSGDYAVGLKAHQLFREVDWFKMIYLARQNRMMPVNYQLISRRRAAVELCKMALPSHKLDTFCWDDWGPALCDTRRSAAKMAEFVARFVSKKILRRG